MPTFEIGAGARVLRGTAAAPTTVTTDLTAYLTSFSVDSSLDTAETTTLNVDAASYAKTFIAALSNASATANVQWDSPTGAQYRAFGDIIQGTAHADGRGKVDIHFDPFGTTEGNLRLSFTALITSRNLGGELGSPVGGSLNFQVDGAVTETTVPAP